MMSCNRAWILWLSIFFFQELHLLHLQLALLHHLYSEVLNEYEHDEQFAQHALQH